jgi:hypothetical protein
MFQASDQQPPCPGSRCWYREGGVTAPHRLSDARSDTNAGLSLCAGPHLLVATRRGRRCPGRGGRFAGLSVNARSRDTFVASRADA